LAEEEIATLLKTARDQLLRAENNLRQGFHDACALFSSLCAENAASALILALGSKPSKRHRNWYVLQIIPKPRTVENQVQTVLQTLKSMEKHVIQARYPLKDERGKLTPPSEYYDKEKAEELLNKARTILEKTETTTKAMKQ